MNLRSLHVLLVVTPLTLPSLYYAQTVPPTPPPSSAPAEERIPLSPFRVSADKDTGYSATNTLDGSRLNTALKDTPGAISVFTRDFIDDIGATGIADLLRYDVSSEEAYQDDQFSGVGNQAGNFGAGSYRAWRTRGLDGSLSVDGFRGLGGEDIYNTERVDSGRGPNAILFGTGAAGGILNLQTKSANVSRNLGQAEFKVGSYSAYRATFDVNRALVKDKLALRLVGLYSESESHQPHQYKDTWGATLAAEYRIAPGTALSVSYEDTRSEGVGGRKWQGVDAITRFLQELRAGRVVWDGAQERYETLNGAVVGAASGVGNLTARTVVVYGENLGSPMLWEGTSRTANIVTLSSAASVFDMNPVVPEWISPSGMVTSTGAGEYGEREFQNLTVKFNHRLFDKLHLELAYNRSRRDSDAIVANNPEIRADLNYRLPNGALNPYFFGNGYYFSQQTNIRNQLGNENETVRASLAYDLDLGKRWGLHRLALLGERHVNHELFLGTREVWAGAPYGGLPEAPATSGVVRRRYFQIDGPLADYTYGHQTDDVFASEAFSPLHIPGTTLRSTWLPPNANGYDDEVTTDSALAVMQNHLFNRRLVTTLGLRFDKLETFGPRAVRDAVTGAWRRATAGDPGPFSGGGPGDKWYEEASFDGLRRSFGAVYHVNDRLSLTANYSTGIQIPLRNRTVLPTEKVPAPYDGESRDYGINFSFLDNRISGAIRYYETSSIGEAAEDGVTAIYVLPNNDVMASFDYYLRQAGLTTFPGNDPIRSIDVLRGDFWSEAGAYLSDNRSRGWEFETIANPTKNWTIRGSYSFTDRSRTNVLGEGEAWWAERMALWESLNTIYRQRTGRSVYDQLLYSRLDAFGVISVAQRIAQSAALLEETRLQQEQGFGNRKHKANVWTRYEFDGRLKGLSIGGGWRYQSRNIAGVVVSTGQTLYGNPRSLFDLLLQYRTKGVFTLASDRVRTTYQINVTNLLDDRTFFITKMRRDETSGALYMFRGFREDPRNVSFTMRLAF